MSDKEDKMFTKPALIQRNTQFVAVLREQHPDRETPGASPRAVLPEYDVRHKRHDPEHSSGCSSSAGWET